MINEGQQRKKELVVEIVAGTNGRGSCTRVCRAHEQRHQALQRKRPQVKRLGSGRAPAVHFTPLTPLCPTPSAMVCFIAICIVPLERLGRLGDGQHIYSTPL